MKTFKIASITHGEDLDGVGSQSIIYRYFEILKKPLIAELLSSDQNFPSDTAVEVICLRTDYNDYMYYWSAILAQNLDKLKSSSKSWFQDRKLNFSAKWKKISEKSKKTAYYKVHDIRRNNGSYGNSENTFT